MTWVDIKEFIGFFVKMYFTDSGLNFISYKVQYVTLTVRNESREKGEEIERDSGSAWAVKAPCITTCQLCLVVPEADFSSLRHLSFP